MYAGPLVTEDGRISTRPSSIATVLAMTNTVRFSVIETPNSMSSKRYRLGNSHTFSSKRESEPLKVLLICTSAMCGTPTKAAPMPRTDSRAVSTHVTARCATCSALIHRPIILQAFLTAIRHCPTSRSTVTMSESWPPSCS